MKHCWHSTGFTLMSSPPQYPHICCHCGVQFNQMIRYKPVPGHGPYLPNSVPKQFEADPLPEGPCEPK
jgi:hypothetical protein